MVFLLLLTFCIELASDLSALLDVSGNLEIAVILRCQAGTGGSCPKGIKARFRTGEKTKGAHTDA